MGRSDTFAFDILPESRRVIEINKKMYPRPGDEECGRDTSKEAEPHPKADYKRIMMKILALVGFVIYIMIFVVGGMFILQQLKANGKNSYFTNNNNVRPTVEVYFDSVPHHNHHPNFDGNTNNDTVPELEGSIFNKTQELLTVRPESKFEVQLTPMDNWFITGTKEERRQKLAKIAEAGRSKK